MSSLALGLGSVISLSASSSQLPDLLCCSESCPPLSLCFSLSLSCFVTVISSVQFSSVTQSCPILCDPMNHSTPSLSVHHQLPEFTQTNVHQFSDAIQPSHPLSSPLLLPSIPPSIRVFSNESALHMRWPKYNSTVLTSFYLTPSG